MNVQNLTPDQREAILTLDESLCIRAGAGCGKTGVLAYHYTALLLKKRLQMSEVVAVTFTEKAAAELKTRIQKVLQEALKGTLPFQDEILCSSVEIALLLEDLSQSPILTLHGLAARIVRDGALLTGCDPHFQILEESTSAVLKQKAVSQTLATLLEKKSPDFQNLIHTYGWRALSKQLEAMLKDWPAWKNISLELSSPGATPQEKESWKTLQQIFQTTLHSYEDFKQQTSSMDFDDLEEKAIHLLSSHPHVARHYHRLWKAFLIDEFQDTSFRQDELITHLLSPNSHLAIVGDEKQSIYSFRGAKPHIFEKYQKKIEASGGKTIFLNHNFRSPPSILKWVNNFFSSVFQNYPHLEATQEEPELPTLEIVGASANKSCRTPLLSAEEKRKQEAQIFAQRIAQVIQTGTAPHQIFFLFRSLNSAPPYFKALREAKIPVYIKSSENFMDRQEITDLIHTMRVVVEPENSLAWVGLLRSPAVGMSDETLLKAREKENKWVELHPLCKSLLKKNPHQNPYEFLNEFLEETDLIALYSATEALSLKAENILQFLNWVYEWQGEHSGGLEDFLKTWDLLQSSSAPFKSLSDQLGLGEAVTLMTIHQAKGLDLPIVVLPDLGNTGRSARLPIAEQWQGEVALLTPQESKGLKRSFSKSASFEKILKEKQKLSAEEENRIFYVATTRSTQKILLGFLPDEKTNALKQNPKVSWITREEKEITASTLKTSAAPHFFKSHPQKKWTHFAVTQLECFLRSKEEYRERYIDQIPAQLKIPPNPPLQRGGLSTLPTLLKGGRGGFTPTEKGTLLHEALYLLTNPSRKFSVDEALQMVLARHSHRVENFDSLRGTLIQTLGNPNFQPILHVEEAYSEIPFLLSLPPYEISGAMDRLIRNRKTWQIVDYKTGKKGEFEFQMLTYCLAASKMMGQPVIKALLYFVESNETHSYEFEEKELKEHEQELYHVMESVNSTLNTV